MGIHAQGIPRGEDGDELDRTESAVREGFEHFRSIDAVPTRTFGTRIGAVVDSMTPEVADPCHSRRR